MSEPITTEYATRTQSDANALWYDYEPEEPVTSSRRGFWLRLLLTGLVLAPLGYAAAVLVAAP
jgi:hypothetical protein